MGSLHAAWDAKRNRTTCGRGHPIPLYMGYGSRRRCKVCDKEQRVLRVARLLDGTQPLGKSRSSTGPKTHCPSGHPYSGSNLRISYRGSKVCKTCANAASAQWKLQKAARGENPNRGKPKQKTVQRIVAAAATGLLRSEIQGRNASIRPVASPNTLVNIRLWLPETWKQLSQQFSENRRLRTVTKQQIVVKPTKPNILSPSQAAELMQRAYRLMPAYLSGDHRDDAVNDLIQAVLEGGLALSEVNAKTAKRFAMKQFQENHNTWGARSLDAALNDDGFSLMDTLQDGDAWSAPVSAGRHIGVRRSA